MTVQIIGTTSGGGVIISVNGVPTTVPPTYAALQGTSYYIQPTDTSGAASQTVEALETLTGSLSNVYSYTGSGQTTAIIPQLNQTVTVNQEIPAGSDDLVSFLQDIQNTVTTEEATEETTTSQLDLSSIMPILLIGIILIGVK